MIIVEFFRDVLSGIWYWLYLLLCIFSFFYVLGIVADSKREKINKKLKEKKSYDIESGKEAAIAAMESKQVLAVNEEEQKMMEAAPVSTTPPNTNPSEINHETPVVVIAANSGQNTNTENEEPVVVAVEQPIVTPNATPMEQARSEEPLVINSNQ